MDLEDTKRLAALRDSGQIETLESESSPTKQLPRSGDRVRVRRLVTYEGEREWVEQTLLRSLTQRGDATQRWSIVGVTLDPFPVVIDPTPDSIAIADAARAQLGEQINDIIESGVVTVRSASESIAPDLRGESPADVLTELYKMLQAVYRLSLSAARPTGGSR